MASTPPREFQTTWMHRHIPELSAFHCPVCFSKGRWDYLVGDLMRCPRCREEHPLVDIVWYPWDIVDSRGGVVGRPGLIDVDTGEFVAIGQGSSLSQEAEPGPERERRGMATPS